MIVQRASTQLQLGWIPEGVAGTRATLTLMRRLAYGGAQDPMVKATALDVVRRSGQPIGSPGALRALFEFVRDAVRYVPDASRLARFLGPGAHVRRGELLATPRAVLDRREEDCDGKATLLAAMIRAIGHPAQLAFRVIGVNPLAPLSYAHVYLVARLRGLTIPLDPTYARTPFGWEYPRAVSREEFAL